MPELAQVIRAGHYLHVPPWELAQQPAVWTEWANAMMDAEAQAQIERFAQMVKAK